MASLFRHAPNRNVYESRQFMMPKSYRHTQVSTETCRLIFGKLPETLDLSALFVEAVCNPASQVLAHREGLRARGLELECMPAQVYSKEGGAVRNVSFLLMFKVQKDKAMPVYMPEPYAEFLTGLYAQLRLERRNVPGNAPAGPTKTEEF